MIQFHLKLSTVMCIALNFLQMNIVMCESQWSPNHYKWFVSEQLLTWEDHENQAKEWGGHLVSIHSEEEYNHVNQLRDGQSVWIGGTRKSDNPSEWEWSDGTPFDYTKWETDEPNNELETKIQQGMGECKCWAWNDFLEGETAGGVYKKELPSLVPSSTPSVSHVPSPVPSSTPSVSLVPSLLPSLVPSLVPSNSPSQGRVDPPQNSTNSTASIESILDVNKYNISYPTCSGSISSSFEESVTCSMTKSVGTNVSLDFLEGNCDGDKIGDKVENINNSSITGMISPEFNITQAGTGNYSFCLVARSFFASEVITEVKTRGIVTYYYTASGNFTLNVTTEPLIEGVVSADVTAEEVTLMAYQCLDDGSEDENAPVAYQQGSTLSICIRSNKPSLVLLTDINMVISPFSSGFTPVLIVDNDIPLKSALTILLPLSDQTIIQIKTVLISLFFLDTKNKISVEGSARFIYKTRKDRVLRILQSTNDVGSSSFDLVVDLEPNESEIFDVSSPSSSNFLSMCIMPLIPLLFSLL